MPVLSHDAATRWSKLLMGVPAKTLPPLNGSSTDWEKGVDAAISEANPHQVYAVFDAMIAHHPERAGIYAQLMNPGKVEPVRPPVEYIDGDRAKLFKAADYVDVLERLGYTFRLCVLDDQVEVNGHPITDVTESEIKAALRDVGLYKTEFARDAWVAHAARHQHHPVKEYLNGLVWNGTDWITTLAAHLVDEHDMMPILLKRWLVGNVARVYEGAQNRMLVLDGEQNLGKSTFVSWLASPLKKHFQEGGIQPDDKDHQLRLATVWIWEVSEMGSTMRRADVEALKAFLTQRDIRVRPPYGRYAINKPAITSFIGTVNNIGGVLNDASGNRRFMSTRLTSIDFGYTAIDIHQVWAQAVAIYRTGEPWKLQPDELETVNRINADYEVENPVEDLILKLFEVDPSRQDWFTPSLRLIELLHDNNWGGRTPTSDSMLVATAMKRLGLKKVYTTRAGITTRGYIGIQERPK